MEEGTTTLTFPETLADEESRGCQGPIVVVTAIPAELCDTCGEAVIDSETVDHINELVKDARYLWHRFPDRLQAEGVTVGGEPGEEGGVIRVDYDRTELPVGRANVG
jgi:YgiT-type zinc finger domain-containing protein